MMKASCWVFSLLVAVAIGVPKAHCEQVVFSEIMYHPPGTLPEYIEVYNNTATPFDVAQWQLCGGVDYLFPAFSDADTGRTFLKPFERILLSGVDEATLRTAYDVASTVRVYGPWSGSLDDSGEPVTLKDKNGLVVCTVKYGNRGRWSPAADGAGHSLVLRSPDKKIDDWRNWTVSRRRGGSPGTEEPVEADTAVNPGTGVPCVNHGQPWRVNEVHFSRSGTVDWVEFYNSSSDAASLDGLFLCARCDLSDKVSLRGSAQAKGWVSQDVSLPVSGGQVTLLLVNACDTVLWAQVFTRPAMGDSVGAFPQGSNEWYVSAASSRDAANDPARNTDVVINEILYAPPSGERSGEFIELYNRGPLATDLSGWRFVEGIDFTIPRGTTIPPDGYLVVAADADWMRATYGAIPVVGNFQGHLSHQGECVRLVDARGNLANEVDYLAGGNWPVLADGGGSSMELQNPWMDNRLPSAWADSNETNKTSFQHYSVTDVYRQLRSDGAATDYKELHLHLVGDGHVVLKNVQVRLNGAGPNLIVNGDKMSTDGRSANGWLAQGTHYASHLDAGQLHIVADGHGDNRANRVEIDVTAMQAGRTYEISFDARWVSGVSRLIVQTWDHSIAASVSLPVPSNLGTPGAENSCFNPLPAPQVDALLHEPAVPAPGQTGRVITPGQTVRVTAHVCSLTPSPKVVLYHRLDNRDGNGNWASKPMSDDGASGGDEVAGDGIYTAQLTEYGNAGQVVQFYVVAMANDELRQLPKDGADRPAMYVVDTPMAAGDLRRMRLVVSALDLRDMADGDSATGPYGYAFPRLSNHYFNMTLIVNEKDVVYNCEVRTNGSPWLRSGTLDRGKFKLPKDNLFRGKGKLVYDNIPGDAVGLHSDRLTRYWLYLLGQPVSENEFIRIKANSGSATLREEIEPVGNDLLDRVYENGSQGELYRIDDEWWFQDSWARTYRPADWSYKGTDNAGRYRTEWMKRTRENEDDYSALIGFFRKVSGTYTQAEIERLIDPVATLKVWAVRGYIGDWDSFSMNRGKNGFFYRRPTDGRFMFFHWDSDLAFQNGYLNSVFYNGDREGMQGVRPYIEQPYNLRLFKHYLAVLVENYTRNSARVKAWLQAEEDASSQYTVSSAYQNWFKGRESPAFSFLSTSRGIAFSITTNGGHPIDTADDTVTLSGVAPLRVSRVEAAGHPEARFAWVDKPDASPAKTTWTWTLAGIVLHTGVNDLTVNAVDDLGAILDQAVITVNKTGNAPPVMALRSDRASWRVSMLNALNMDVLDSCDPDGGLLNYTWSVAGSDVAWDANAQDVATAVFPRPGLYAVSVTGQDAEGASATIQREAAVYAPEDFSSFDGPRLEPFWTLENVVLRPNFTAGPSYSLTEVPGQLVLQVWDAGAFPLGASTAAYPFVWRSLPSLTDWAFLSQVSLRGQIFGDYITGVMAEMNEAGGPVRYAFGIEDGGLLAMRRITASGSVILLQSQARDSSQAELRIRRTADRLWFEQRTRDVWTAVGSVDAAGSVAVKAGLFVATDTPQSVKAAFDYAVLVDPLAGACDLRRNLRLSEIMYNPLGGNDYEFVELVNVGTAPLDLAGVRFTAGIDYTFAPALLAPNQCLVVARSRAAFLERYDVTGMNLAPGDYSGKLDNAGETIELSDPNGAVILSVTYGTSGAWPKAANGQGRSLEVIDPAASLSDPANWRASRQVNGSPGTL